eukprot:1142914-Pyramimonas_sp.AAC.1
MAALSAARALPLPHLEQCAELSDRLVRRSQNRATASSLKEFRVWASSTEALSILRRAARQEPLSPLEWLGGQGKVHYHPRGTIDRETRKWGALWGPEQPDPEAALGAVLGVARAAARVNPDPFPSPGPRPQRAGPGEVREPALRRRGAGVGPAARWPGAGARAAAR